ncbi:hypothetical protein N7481_008730 [Penicillium waksmanii]|uniref:uncharacterized protein n=1 Tax=Penicillium waksmanii TaxID=69791 RepID=UPI0025485FDF|nr:uncharacterized protein N7481_008730 [Penicillium waksmanii]KAJ5975023.1 hypothetical protein N7481_008730 [Penicillium waksmanii]
MTGLNASVSAGWYTFSNLGPITTTFTPAPSCTASGRMMLGYLVDDGNYLNLKYGAEPTLRIKFDGCTPSPSPTTTATPETTIHHLSEAQKSAFAAQYVDWVNRDFYYSPGLHCPSDWETIGLVARDASSSLSSSGIYFATTTTTTDTKDDYYYYRNDYEYPASVLKGILEPKETMVACCPSGMTADKGGFCYSEIEGYKATVGYQVGVGNNYEYGSSTEIFTLTRDSSSVLQTEYLLFETATTARTDTYTETFDRAETSLYSAFSYAPVITMLHHESDLKSATATATATSTATSNAAGRISARASVWDGFSYVVGISAVTAALGAAMILPW